MSRKLINERAFLMAHELLGIVQNSLHPKDRQQAYVEFFEEFYDVCRRGLNEHETHAGMMRRRLKPSLN